VAAGAQSLTDPQVELRRAAASCILSVSRSVQTLRTTLVESGVTRPLCGLLDDGDMQVRCTAVAAMCNLVMEFSPVKKLAMDLGVIAKLVKGTHSEHSELRLNSVWGLKNLLYEADSPEASVAKSRVMDLLSWPQLLCGQIPSPSMFLSSLEGEGRGGPLPPRLIGIPGSAVFGVNVAGC